MRRTCAKNRFVLSLLVVKLCILSLLVHKASRDRIMSDGPHAIVKKAVSLFGGQRIKKRNPSSAPHGDELLQLWSVLSSKFLTGPAFVKPSGGEGALTSQTTTWSYG